MTMKQILVTLLLVFPSLVHAQGFTTNGSDWLYFFCDFPVGDKIDVNNSTFDEYWNLNGIETINSKQYYKLFRSMDFADMNLPMPIPEKYSKQGFIINVRLQDGKVYGIKEQYIQYMKSLYPEQENFYLGPAEDESEVLLYDFTLNVGDTYPCADKSTVTEVYNSREINGRTYKIIHLSNGIIIIENIGCINSLETLIAYQNTGRITETFNWRIPTSRTTWEWQERNHQGRLIYLELNNQRIYLHDFVETDDPNYFVIDNIATPEIVNSKSLNGQWYDLSGRRLSMSSASSVPSVLPKGVYIRDGKKVVVK